MKPLVLVGLSGGIDSAMTAFLLKEKGYKVTGVHLELFENEKSGYKERIDFIANTIGIEWIEYNASKLFEKEVIGYFTRFYLEGRTPSPCAHCNPAVKWKVLKEVADSFQINNIATGHYIKIINDSKMFRIFKASDHAKDQSYYMWKLQQDILSKALTPLGSYQKDEIKKIAQKIGFAKVSGSKESTGLCFAGGLMNNELLHKYIPGLSQKVTPGIVIDRQGKEIGRHKGYIYYTVGQKKELELNTKEKLCVANIDAAQNIIIADTWQNLYKNEFFVEDFTFADVDEIKSLNRIQVMVRGFGLNPKGDAILSQTDELTLKVKLENPAWAIAPGQPAVFYSGDKLLGGGIIKSN